ACSYEVRVFGVRSAMSIARALRLCPQAQLLPVRMSRYQEASAAVFRIFSRYTDRIEPVSSDEAFLDLTGCERLFGAAATVAAQIRAEVRQELGLTVSAGVAPNKFLAKLASEAAKPDGLLELLPAAVEQFLLPLPVGRLWGVGAVTAERLRRQGVETVAALRGVDKALLRRWFGSSGELLWFLARGEDDRPVQAVEGAKSIGAEETFAHDLSDPDELRRELLALAERVARRVRRLQLVGCCLTLKVRYADFETVTRSQTLAEGIDHAPALCQEAEALLARTEAGRRPVRLLGVTLSRLCAKGIGQQSLFQADGERKEALDQALDHLHRRFGEGGVCRASLLGRRLPLQPEED
ncbi:MAG: DNA polymerase IV, partial [Desulfuromonadales bacterium]|nr:DNA polymerase IV [Desulfuromonadales bacterium]